MNYSEQANLVMKVKSVCESVNNKDQVKALRNYVKMATAKITDPMLKDDCRIYFLNVEHEYFPPVNDYNKKQLEAMAHEQSIQRQITQNRFIGQASMLGIQALGSRTSPLSGLADIRSIQFY